MSTRPEREETERDLWNLPENTHARLDDWRLSDQSEQMESAALPRHDKHY
jgi:hypothetical protein